MTMPSRKQIHPVLLRTLYDLGGRARPREVVSKVVDAFPKLTPEEIAEPQTNGKGNKLANRIRWARQDLMISGRIDGSERGVWKLTPLGEEAATGEKLDPPEIGEETGVEDDTETVIVYVPNDFERVAKTLISAATESSQPERLEQSVGEALELLGFDTEVIGGPGATDVLAVAPLGVARYTMVVDAKSSHSSRVSENQINWYALQEHRKADRADYAVVVGPDFAAGRLRERAAESNICLLTVEELAQLVNMQANTPVSLSDLRPLFAASPLARTALEVVKSAAERRRRRLRLIERVIETIDTYNGLKPDLVLATPETLFGLMLMDADPLLRETTFEEVQQTLALLQALGIVRQQENGAGCVSTTSLRGAGQILNALTSLQLNSAQSEQPNASQSSTADLSS